ncbi:response regulator transcription factor [Gracilinema caldarium]|uniref:response regulator transcription factor n=1 Tax=Gracilinema caldarium TaxID=215591 RepID=UPI0026F310A7|nr:response regulator [Gracilinema caldarium]
MQQVSPFLIIEDEIAQHEYLKLLLQRLGLSADFAGTIKEAEKLLRNTLLTNNPYKVIFLDIMLPDGTGREILHQLRTDPEFSMYAESKIIMLTALDELKDVAGAFSKECDAYITKGMQKDKLIQILKKYKIIV